MATIVSSPSVLCFSSNVADIVFHTDDASGTIVLDIVASGTRHNILTETLYADADENVTIADLSSLVEGYARQHMQVTLECSFTDTDGTTSISPVTVLYAMVDVGTTASDFTANHFLTILNGEKLTALGRKEYISAYGASQLTIYGDVFTASGTYGFLVATLNALETSGSISRFDVSPDNISSTLGLTSQTLLYYSVFAGNRVQNFRVIESDLSPNPSLLFKNSFGCLECLHCIGIRKKESKYDRQSARIRGVMRNYRITENLLFTANTGWLNEAMAEWADELFRSDKVWLLDNGREVIISDSKSEFSNEDDDMPAFEFTYSYAQRMHNVLKIPVSGNVFDETFDYTFD